MSIWPGERPSAKTSSVAIENPRSSINSNDNTVRNAAGRLEDIVSSGPKCGIDYDTVNDIYCILSAYYRITHMRYGDLIYTQRVDHHLLNEPDSPFGIFSPLSVASVNPEELEEIAGESRSSKGKHQILEKEINTLKKCKGVIPQ